MRCKLLLLALGLFYSSLFAQEFKGEASYYPKSFDGNMTASGEAFDSALFTAAHCSLPFNTKVKVTNLSNDKSIIVKINDRGPFVDGRIIDLSRSAAKKLGFIRKGVARVKIEILDNQRIKTDTTKH